MTTTGTSRRSAPIEVLRGKVAVVTGASRGIGAAAARAFAEAGAAVVVAARDVAGLTNVAEQIVAAGGEARAVQVDVGDAESVERLVDETVAAFGRLDVAFNNAGNVHRPAPLADVAIDDFDSVVRVHLRGVFLSMRYEIPAMIDSGGGAIVNMSSTAGLRGVPGIAGYVAAKHAIVGLTKTAALDYAARGVRVNALAPGPILTDRLAGLEEAQRREVARHVPLGRLGTPEDVAAAAVWLCTDEAAFVTGAALPVDGGRLSAGA